MTEENKECSWEFGSSFPIRFASGQGMKWIKCSERLPDPYKDVLVTDGEKCWVASISDLSYKVFLASHPDYKRETQNEYGAPFITYSTPTHWMPLPEPPED